MLLGVGVKSSVLLMGCREFQRVMIEPSIDRNAGAMGDPVSTRVSDGEQGVNKKRRRSEKRRPLDNPEARTYRSSQTAGGSNTALPDRL